MRTANLLGTFAEDHPIVIAAREAEVADSNATSRRSGDSDPSGWNSTSSLNAEPRSALNAKTDAGRERVARLAGARAEYANLVAAVDDYTKLVEAARKNLGDARAKHASAHTASVIGRIDGVETGVRPVGPGRTTITAAGGVAGLILGLGVVFLFAGPVPADASPSCPKANSTSGPVEPFGMFRGTRLDEAVRQVETSNGHSAK